MRRRLLAAALFALGLSAPPAVAADADTIRAGREAAKICETCHHFTRSVDKFGPPLVGVIGRPVASVARFPYSPAMKGLGGEWTEERIAEFVNDPKAFAPGTSMNFEGYKDMAKARAVAAYVAVRTRR